MHRGRRFFLWVLVITITLCAAGVAVFHHFWPFTESAVRNRLAKATSAQVEFKAFHEKYFPPGCTAEQVVFRREKNGAPLLSIQRLSIQSGPLMLLRHHIGLIRAEGLHLLLNKAVFKNTRNFNQGTIVDSLVGDDGELEVQQGSQPPLRFLFHQFRAENLGGNGSARFAAVFDNPLPRGLVRTSGSFGPWNKSEPETTTVSGKYSLENADLGVFGSIAGILSSSGNFSGTFKHIDVEGSARAPNFQVTATKHQISLQSRFSATVDGTAGDTTLKSVRATLGKDQIDGHGRIGRGSDGKREAAIDLQCKQGRIEDTFYPFIHASVSPIAGSVAFRMHIVIPGGKEPFLKKIQLDSDFRIADARFTNTKTETRLRKISEEPGQKDEQGQTASNPVALAGRVIVTDGTARFKDLLLSDQGASAQLRGSYSLINQGLDMHGKLETKASLSKTTSGIKAAFAKVIEPFFKKKHDQKVVPVKISGTFHHPSFGLDLNSKM